MAQGVVGTLQVMLGLNAAKFNKGLSDSQKRLQAAAKVMRRAVAASAAIGAGLSAVALRSGSAIDAQAKLAQSLGTTVASMQNLQRAGQLAGVEMSGIEQATKDLHRRLSQAADGAGPAAEALSRLGLSAQELMGVPLDQRVEEINAAIRDFIPVAQQAAVAGQLFGEEGSIAMARLQPEVLRQASDEVERLGGAISDVDAKRIEKANDQISKLSLAVKVAAQELALKLLPPLGRMAESLAAALEKGRPLRALLDGLAEAGRVLGTVLSVLVDALVFLAASQIPALIGALVAAGRALTVMEVQFIAGATAMKGFAAASALLHRSLALLGGPVGIGVGVAAVFGVSIVGAFRDARNAAADLKAALAETAVAQRELNGATERYNRELSIQSAEAMRQAAEAARDSAAKALEEAQDKVDALSRGLARIFSSDRSEAVEQMEALRGKLAEAEARLDSASIAAARLRGEFELSGPVGDAFSARVEEVNLAARSASEVMRDLADATSEATSGAVPAVGAFSDLVQEYGGLASAAFEAAKAQRDLATAQTMDAARGLLDDLGQLSKHMSMTAQEAQRMDGILSDLGAANTPAQMADAFGDLTRLIDHASGGVANMDAETRSAYAAAAALTQQLLGAAQAADGGSGAANSFANMIAFAAKQANELWRQLNGARNALAPLARGLQALASSSPMIRGIGGAIAGIKRGAAAVVNSKEVAGLLGALGEAGTEALRLARSADATVPSLGGAARAARKMKEELTPAQEAAKKLAEELKSKVISAVDGVANAFGDFVVGGFRDFKGFVNSVLGSFKKMLSQMIAMAAKNKILVSLGLATAPVAGVAKQALGGIGGSISGIIGKALGSWGGGSGILGGLGSVVTGFMKGGLGGAVSGLSTALGGGLTSAIGGLLPVVGLAAAALSFFRTKTKQLDAGLRVTIGQAGLLAEEFKKVEKSRFWGLSKRTSTTYSAVADDLQNSLSSAFNDIKASASSAATAIGLSAAALDGYSKQITLSTKGMSGDQAQQALMGKLQSLSSDMAMTILKSAAPTAIFAGLSDEVAKMAPGAVGPVKKALSAALSGAVSRSGASVSAGAVSQLAGRVSGAVSNALKQSAATVGQSAADLAREQWAQQFIRPGEDAAQALQALSGSFTTINAALKGLGLQMMGASLDMAKVARDVLDQVGGAQAFGQAADLYFNQFYSVAERASLMGGRFADAMAGLKVGPLPKTMAEFRALVDELNAAGKNADAVKVISLAPLFNEVIRLREEAKPAAEAVKEVAKALDNTADIARERQNLLRRLYEAQGNTVALRKMELEALFPANQALQNRIWGILDETKASEAAAEAARAAKAELDRIKGEHMGLMRELWRLQGREDLLRKDQLAGLAASNRALQRNIWALQDQAKAAQDLEDATRSTIDLLRSPLALDSQRYANRYDAALAAARERDREIEGKARDAQTTELRLIRAALSRIEQDARDTNLQGS